MEFVVAKERASEPVSELTQLITGIVDKILKNRRFRPIPPQAAMSKREFGVAHGLGMSSVEKEIREGRLEAKKVGRRTIITPDARDRWLAGLPRGEPASEAEIAAIAEASAEANKRYLASRQRIRIAEARDSSLTP
jgi:hypothetical protein